MDTMYPAKINSPATTLDGGINDSETTIAVVDASKLATAPNIAVIGTGEDAETILYTGISTNDLTGCTREFQGTAKAWDSGTSVARFFTAYDYDTLRTNLETHDPATTGVHGAGGNTLWHGGLTNIVDKTHLSQDFGASAGRLRNLIPTPIGGLILRISNTAGGALYGKIDDTPAAHGGQGLDATHVPYDNDSEEDAFNGLFPYDGSGDWGQLILHNTTRSTSRRVVSVDRTNNVIATTSSTDSWEDDDDIEFESQTVDSGSSTIRFIDIDLSDFIGTGVDAIFLFAVLQNNTATQITNALYFHPYTTFDTGKRQWAVANVGNEQNTVILLVDVIDQKITMAIHSGGSDDCYVMLSVKATVEFADT